MPSVENCLREHGYKVTPGRKTLLSILLNRWPSNLSEIRSAFSEIGSANLTTLYRTVSEFRASGIVHGVETDSGEKLVLCDRVSHESGSDTGAEHLIRYCESCGSVEEAHAEIRDPRIVRKVSQERIVSCNRCKR